MSAATLCLADCVSDAMNKVGMHDRSVNHVTRQPISALH